MLVVQKTSITTIFWKVIVQTLGLKIFIRFHYPPKHLHLPLNPNVYYSQQSIIDEKKNKTMSGIHRQDHLGRIKLDNTTMAKGGRMPLASANLLVQLPPQELRQIASNPQAAVRYSASSPPSSPFNQAGPSRWMPNNGKTALSNVQLSDVQLLAESFQERREKEAKVFMWQQKLILASEPDQKSKFDRETFKRALTQLSLSSWLQVLQERHLANKCAYPTCSNKPKKPHISFTKNSILPSDAPRYRISLSKRTIERDERDDPGGQNGFCSNTCWRRGEWVSRWVLNNGRSTRKQQREVGNDYGAGFGLVGGGGGEDDESSTRSFGSAIRNPNGLGNEVDEGGRWERMMDEEHWTEIELLEDLEEKGEVDRLSDDEENIENEKIGSPLLSNHSQPNSATIPQTEMFSRSPDSRDVLQGQPTTVARQHAKQRADTKGTAEGFLNLIDSLQIRERQPGELQSDDQVKHSTEMDDSTEKSTFSNAVLDSEGDVSMSEDNISEEEDRGNSSMHANHRRQLTEEEKKKVNEEDDLFAQAWQAMNEEKAKGTWEED